MQHLTLADPQGEIRKGTPCVDMSCHGFCDFWEKYGSHFEPTEECRLFGKGTPVEIARKHDVFATGKSVGYFQVVKSAFKLLEDVEKNEPEGTYKAVRRLLNIAIEKGYTVVKGLGWYTTEVEFEP